jgi:hypothetical protein
LPTKVVTTFHPHRLTDSLDSRWGQFIIRINPQNHNLNPSKRTGAVREAQAMKTGIL